ncbi:MAG: T9SS type A sorting domain-containing protein [Bacteroidetes bacterium]|nr:T9SS type A sorting domain-containing protein [Bacteroidota bacterium]
MKTFSLSFRLLISCTLFAVAAPLLVSGQYQAGGVPLSFGRALDPLKVITAEISGPSQSRISEIEATSSLAYKFALNLPIDITMSKSGTTEILNDGQRVWRLSLHSAGAKALILYFDSFGIPEGGKLFVYNPSRTLLYGAYTPANMNSFNTFASPLIPGETLVLEYNAPAGIVLPDLHISELSYAFRGVSDYELSDPIPSAGSCEVNVNCSEGDNWQKQKRGVVKIIVKDSNGFSRKCSGSLVNNTSNDGIPYVLTADHCGRFSRPVDLSQWLFYFNYEMPGCPATTPLTPASMLGAVFKAHGGTETTGSDFYLVRLTEKIPDSLHVYFNGWSREDVASPNGTGIHHPTGDVKKISTYNSPLVPANWPGNPYTCHWRVYWNYTTHGHGVTEGGSSGSPIFNSSGQIVGTLTGGDSGCDTSWLNSPDYYGQFSWHWDKNGSDSAHMLKYWLDPNNTGVTNMGGWSLGINDQVYQTGLRLYPNPVHEKAFLDLEGGLQAGGAIHVSITGMLGNPVTSPVVTEISPGHYIVDLHSLPSGIYIIIVTGQNYPGYLKLVKI